MSKGRAGEDVESGPWPWLREVPVPGYVWRSRDGELELSEFNRAALEFTRGRVEGLIGARASELHRDEPGMGRLLAACLEQGATQRARGPCSLTSTGEMRELDVTCLFQPPDAVVVLTLDLAPAEAAFEAVRLSEACCRRTETRLREAEERLRRVQASLEDAQRMANLGSWHWDLADGSWWCSDQVYRIFGLSAQQPGVTDQAFLRAVREDERAGVLQAIEELLTASASHGIDFRILRPDGEERQLHVSGELLRDDEGRPERILGSLQDLTETRRAHERLRFLSSAVEQAADHVFITDREGHILYANPAFETQTGFRLEELLGQTPRSLKSGLHASEYYEKLWQTILSGQVFRDTVVNRKKDGSTYFEEKSIAPLRDARGEITHFVSAGRDVTERRRTEEEQARLQEAVRQAAAEWRATFDAVDALMLVLDEAGRIERLNRAAREALGKPYAELQGMPLRELVVGGLWSTSLEAAERVLVESRSQSAQVQDEEGRTWDVSAVVAPPAREGGRRAIVTARDVTALVALQESLRRSETMSAMGRIVAGVAHEVRNPLFAISATVDAFREELLDRPEFVQYGALLKAEVERMSALMQDLLEYGRPSPVRLDPGSLPGVFERAVRFCQPQATAAGVEVLWDPLAKLPPVPMDRGRLVQVFQNLLGNAIEHAPRESAVRLAAELAPDGAAVECQVEDRGPGFRGEDLARVFEPFFTRRRGGTGLGLSIVERLVMAHGGEVSVANRSGGGAVVTVRLPLRGES